MKRWPIPRPTEHAALRALDHVRLVLPSQPVLFAGLVTAQAVGDQHGANLFAHAIARQGGEVGE
ncbi:hypothetical protein [Streptomyces fulvoviolaceus]|uniref:hypothetical protein n=1 Tax=Streptomyces fulvoviolaceus TaxID=285535 RepID=UPI0021BFD833|nr:hypothetical protein [Streptomyces fulvoviolaceus]MCT9078814.1 hypothetical protein [Streptomyces fulvoviolaceus]